MPDDGIPLGGPGSGARREPAPEVRVPEEVLTPPASRVFEEDAPVVPVGDYLHGRLPRHARASQWIGAKLRDLNEALKSARKRDGFTARVTTALLLNVLAVPAIVIFLPSVILKVMALAALVAIDSVFLAMTLRDAYKPSAAAPEGALIPGTGSKAIRYRVNRLYGRADLVPALRPEDHQKTIIRLFEERVRELRQAVRPVIWIANSSGKNGKSMMSVIIASIIGRVTRQPCFVVPTMANDKTGRAGKLTGLKGRSASMRQLHTLLESGQLKDPGDVYEHVFSNEDGAYVVSEDPVGDVNARYLGNGMWRKVFRFLLRASRIAVLDTGNDGAHENSVTATGLEEAHVAIFTAWKENVDGMDKLKEALAEYLRYARIFNKSGLPVVARQSAVDIPMEEKIVNSIIVFNAVDPASNLSGYARHVRIEAEEAPEFGGDICFIRYDEYLRYLLDGFSIDEMQRETYLDYLVVIALAFERAAESMGVQVKQRHPAIREYGLRIA